MTRTPRSFDQLSDLKYEIATCEYEERPVKAVGESESPLVVL